MKRNGQQQKLFDDARLLRSWQKWHREEREIALTGPHGAMIERLVFILDSLTLDSAPLLVAYIRGVDWATVHYPTRLTVLHEVNVAITRLRERNGMAPFDDAMPGDPPNVFETIRTILIPAEAAPSRSACRLEEKHASKGS
jgi:hypothetical protein